MRDSPFAAFAFLGATIVIPIVLGYLFLWWLLQYTNTGLLVFKEEVAATAVPAAIGSQRAEKVLQCTYFTGSEVLYREFSAAKPAEDEAASPATGCPWRIEAS